MFLFQLLSRLWCGSNKPHFTQTELQLTETLKSHFKEVYPPIFPFAQIYDRNLMSASQKQHELHLMRFRKIFLLDKLIQIVFLVSKITGNQCECR